jgi:hypothetical protein
MNPTNSLYDIRLQMWRKGGEFVRHLSQTLGAADPENREKIMDAFPEIIRTYDTFATIERQIQEGLEGAE